MDREYGYSVFSTVFCAEFLGKKLNIIDCPGSDDFVGGAITALNVTDTAVMMVDAHYGVEVGTRNLLRYTRHTKKPVIFLINQLDVEHADYDVVFEQLKENFGSNVVAVQYPVTCGPSFNAVVDVLKMKMYKWKSEGGTPEVLDIPDSEKDKAEDLHQKLIEAAAENDETLMEKYFDQGSLSEEEMREGIRCGLISRGMYPVFCVDAERDMGVRRLMEFLGNVVPSVSEMPAPLNTMDKEIKPIASAPASIYVFKTTVEPHIGEVSYFKVMSGTVREGEDFLNEDRGSKERIAQLLCVNGQIRVKVSELVAGDIGASVKLKDVRTGNTLNGKGADNKFDFIKYPAPKYRRAIKAMSESDTEKLNEVLLRMHEEDPTLIIEQSKELKQTIVHSQGEFHLRTLKWRR